jgi:hypothetical protein
MLFSPLLLLATAVADIPSHLVTSLPGYEGPLPTKHWSGYLSTPHPNGTVHTHYVGYEDRSFS